MGLANEPSQDLPWRRGWTLRRSLLCFSGFISSSLYEFPMLIRQGQERQLCSLSLCWLACKAGICPFVSKEQMSSWEWNMLTSCILCHLSILAWYDPIINASYSGRPHRWVWEQIWHQNHLSCWFPVDCRGRDAFERLLSRVSSVVGVLDQYFLNYN